MKLKLCCNVTCWAKRSKVYLPTCITVASSRLLAALGMTWGGRLFLNIAMLISLCLFQTVSYAATPYEALAQHLQRLNTMQAEFEQKTYNGTGKRVLQENQGEMSFKKPELFRWSVKSPIQQLIVSNGAKLWIYDIDLEQVSIQKLKKGENDKPAMVLLSDPASLNQNYTVKQFKDKLPGIWYELTPKKPDQQFQKMALYFENNTLKQLQFLDAASQWSNITFKHIQTNIEISNKNFDFTPPPGVDVVGLSG